MLPKLLTIAILVSTVVPLHFLSNVYTPDSGGVVLPVYTSPTKTEELTIQTEQKKIEVMAWVYPGSPACGAGDEYGDGRQIDIIKSEYFMISEGGKLTLLSEDAFGCNGYSSSNILDIKKYSKEQYATISSAYAVDMDRFLRESVAGENELVSYLVSFVEKNGLTGIEIDFEDFSSWSLEVYERYKQFVDILGTELHEAGKKLIVDGPAIANGTQQSWYAWRYEDFSSLPVDRVVVMVYDYQFDEGVGEAIAPIFWIKDVVSWVIDKIPDTSKISIGIPSYAYKGLVGTQKFSLLTYEQISREPGFNKALRDEESFEMTWREGNHIYFYQDGQSMEKKLDVIKNAGITSVSVWHIGGNQWFSE